MLLLLTACSILSRECDLMYVANSTSVAFEVVSEGEWSWAVTGEGVDMACSVTLPAGDDAACDDETNRLAITPTDTGWTIGSSADAGGAPILHVSLWHDDTLLIDEDVEPEWTIDEPNGKGCGEHFSWNQTWTVE